MDNKGGKLQEIQENNIIKDWPIEPTFLSVKAGTERFDKKYSPNKDGLFDANELRGILADASATLWETDGIEENGIGTGQNFALFQVVPKAFNAIGDSKRAWFDAIEKEESENSIIKDILCDRKILRIHPGNLYPNMNCCELFRKCKYEDDTGKEFDCKYKCSESDSRIALLYHEKLQVILKESKDKYDWNKFCDRLNEIIKEYNNKIKIEYTGKYNKDVDNINLYLLDESQKYNQKHKNKIEKRPYVGYRCIYSGFMEYFFPITHAGKVVAVLMHGQCPTQDLDKDKMFKRCRDKEEMQKEPNRKLIKWINDKFDADKSEMVEKKKLFNLSKDRKSIASKQFEVISELINNLEEKIESSVKGNSRYYVSDNFFHLERQFRNVSKKRADTATNVSDKLYDLRDEIKNLDIRIKDYERLLSIALRSIISRFNLSTEKEFIRIYAMESSIANRVNPDVDVFNLIGDSTFASTYKTPPDNRKYKKITLNKIKERNRILNKEELLSADVPKPYFPERDWGKLAGFDPVKDDIHVEFSFSSQVAYLIWERYDDLNKDKKSYYYNEYISYLNLMNHTLLEPYVILERMKLEKNLEASMRISSHESAQVMSYVIPTINNAGTLSVLKEAEIYQGPDEIKILPYTIIDVSRRISILNSLFNRLSLIFKGEKPKLELADFHRIIYATESLFREKAYTDNMQKVLVRYDKPDLDRFSLLTNYEYLSHILFNLMDNAIKYGQRGSNIYIRAHLHYKSNNNSVQVQDKLTISVISYGAKIEDEDRKNMFELYYRSPQATKEGMGIGLFLVEKLCNLLGYTIECIPGEKPYVNYHLPVTYHYEKQNGNENYNALYLEEIVNKDVLKKDWEINDRDKASIVSQPTYKNEFKITIPGKIPAEGKDSEEDALKLNYLIYGKNITD